MKTILANINNQLPALQHSETIQNTVAKYGFDWQEIPPVFDKVTEELEEVREAWLSGDQAHTQEEIGDLLFVAVNLARHLKVNPETALKQSCEKFKRRFNYIEQQLDQANRELLDCDLTELDALWDKAKQTLDNP